MARTRLIRPSAPHDEAVASLSIPARLTWAYLPCHADREGRLADNPFTLKLAILPLDNVDMNALLAELWAAKLIERYTVDGRNYINIRTFLKHQKPHHREESSTIPAYCVKAAASPGQAVPRHVLAALDPVCLIRDPVKDPNVAFSETEKARRVFSYPENFSAFWDGSNGKGSKYKAHASWVTLGRPDTALLTAAWKKWTDCAAWKKNQGEFQPHVTTWLNGRMHEQNPPGYKPPPPPRPVDEWRPPPGPSSYRTREDEAEERRVMAAEREPKRIELSEHETVDFLNSVDEFYDGNS